MIRKHHWEVAELKLRMKRQEVDSYLNKNWKNILSRGKSLCKGPWLEMISVRSRNISMAGVEGMKGEWEETSGATLGWALSTSVRSSGFILHVIGSHPGIFS